MRPQVLNPTTCKTLLFLFPLCFSLPYIARADDSERGSWAVQFRVTENFTLSSFGGSVLSIKKHISDRNAFRASVDLSISNNSEDYTDNIIEPRTRESNSHRVGFGFDYLRYFSPKSQFSLFLGVGPFFRVSRATQTTEQGEPGESFLELDEESYGARGIIGIEWFVTNRIGLHSEYGVQVAHTTSDRVSQGNGRIQEASRTSLQVGGRAAFLGASVYF